MSDRDAEATAEIEATGNKPLIQILVALGALQGIHAGADSNADVAQFAGIGNCARKAVVTLGIDIVGDVVILVHIRGVRHTDLETAELRREIGDLFRVAPASVLADARVVQDVEPAAWVPTADGIHDCELKWKFWPTLVAHAPVIPVSIFTAALSVDPRMRLPNEPETVT